MRVNQLGQPILENVLFFDQMESHKEVAQVLFMLLDKLNLQVVWTNATKHGNFEFELQRLNQPEQLK